MQIHPYLRSFPREMIKKNTELKHTWKARKAQEYEHTLAWVSPDSSQLDHMYLSHKII